MVDLKGIEPSTSRMRTERSPNGYGKQTLEPEFTFFVHITGYKMNSKAIKIDFRAEHPPIWWKNAIINAEKFEIKQMKNRYILARNRLAMMIFLKIFEMVDTW